MAALSTLLASRSRRARARAGAGMAGGAGKVRKVECAMRSATAWDAPGAVVECATHCLSFGTRTRPRTQCMCIPILLAFLLVCTAGKAGPGLHSTTPPPH